MMKEEREIKNIYILVFLQIPNWTKGRFFLKKNIFFRCTTSLSGITDKKMEKLKGKISRTSPTSTLNNRQLK